MSRRRDVPIRRLFVSAERSKRQAGYAAISTNLAKEDDTDSPLHQVPHQHGRFRDARPFPKLRCHYIDVGWVPYDILFAP